MPSTNPDIEKRFIEAEDDIITYFCELHGGLEFAMPIVQTQIKRVGLDFSKPTRGQLVELSKSLVEITRSLKGQEIAKKEQTYFNRIIRESEGNVT